MTVDAGRLPRTRGGLPRTRTRGGLATVRRRAGPAGVTSRAAGRRGARAGRGAGGCSEGGSDNRVLSPGAEASGRVFAPTALSITATREKRRVGTPAARAAARRGCGRRVLVGELAGNLISEASHADTPEQALLWRSGVQAPFGETRVVAVRAALARRNLEQPRTGQGRGPVLPQAWARPCAAPDPLRARCRCVNKIPASGHVSTS